MLMQAFRANQNDREKKWCVFSVIPYINITTSICRCVANFIRLFLRLYGDLDLILVHFRFLSCVAGSGRERNVKRTIRQESRALLSEDARQRVVRVRIYIPSVEYRVGKRTSPEIPSQRKKVRRALGEATALVRRRRRAGAWWPLALGRGAPAGCGRTRRWCLSL